MQTDRIASLMGEKPATGNRGGVFIYTHVSMEDLAMSLMDDFKVHVRGPHHYGFETMQQQEAAIAKEEAVASDIYAERLREDRLAGKLDSDDRDDAGNYRVFVMSEPRSDEERRALAAISTSLVTSALNDPSHTVAAFLPVGSVLNEGIPKYDGYQEPIWGGLRSLLTNLGVVQFENTADVKKHLVN
jgi:hypothetical protein